MFPILQICLNFVTIGVNTCIYKLQHSYKVCNFYIKTMKYSCLFSGKYKVTANVRDKDHKTHHFVT